MTRAKGKKTPRLDWRGRLLLVVMTIGAVVFMPTTVLLSIGMLPTIIAMVIDRTRDKTRAITVGCMNFTGCCPYWLDLITKYNHSMEGTIQLITEPLTITVMYAAAAAGYLINWAMSGLVSTIMIQQGEKRLKNIEKEQAELVRKWGRGVTGQYTLDRYGFPIDDEGEQGNSE